MRLLFLGLFCLLTSLSFAESAPAEVPATPRIESLSILSPQPHESDPAVIWHDDFEDVRRQQAYPEKSGALTTEEHFGTAGKSLEMRYPKGERGIGGRKIFFGDSPTHRDRVLRPDETFTDIYWRVYVKHPADWRGGGPAKLSRATSLVPPGWRQAMIAHVWSKGDALTLDPASGVRDGQVVTTRYNDFPNLRWLGNHPPSEFKLHGDDGLGWWVCVEARAKLNTPGKSDGLNQLWIDGQLQTERTGLNWRDTFTERGINAVFLESYWNQGSPVDQARWLDQFVVSTKPIGPVVCSTNPVLIKTDYQGPGTQKAWQVEVARNADRKRVVWRSHDVNNGSNVTVDARSGTFLDLPSETQGLPADTGYVSRVRQQSDRGLWSPWSPWHQTFRTADRDSLKPSS
jgi:hypothetical protein